MVRVKSDHPDEEDNSKLVTENLLSFTQMLRVQKSEAGTEPVFINGKQWFSCVATVASSPQSPPLNNGGDGAEKMFGFKASTSGQITAHKQQWAVVRRFKRGHSFDLLATKVPLMWSYACHGLTPLIRCFWMHPKIEMSVKPCLPSQAPPLLLHINMPRWDCRFICLSD